MYMCNMLNIYVCNLQARDGSCILHANYRNIGKLKIKKIMWDII